MAITVQANPANLTWGHFKLVSNLLDPNDGTSVDAVTLFNYNLPNRRPRMVNGRAALADPMVLTITPNCKVRQGTSQTAGLLSHEQFHYDVGIVTARALARFMTRLRTRNFPDLRTELNRAVRLHFTRRADLIQRRYDKDTRHGQDAHQQRIWKRNMASCLAKPRTNQLGGFWL